MSSLSLAIMLLLRIAAGLGEESLLAPDDELHATGSSFPCHLVRWECSSNEDCLRDVCSYILDVCPKRPGCSYLMYKCWDNLPNCFDHDTQPKRSSITKNSYLFMKLHPVLNRAADPSPVNVPTRFRRIGVRLGSEFLGKRTAPFELEEEEEEDGTLARGRRLPGTELLGKRYGSEMLGKRNVELLGKRAGEFLGKRSGELLGKRSGEFLGKRSGEFLGKRSGEFLGKRSNELLGKRDLRYRGVGECFARHLGKDPRLFVRYLKLTTRLGNPSDESNRGAFARDRTK